MKKFIFTLAVLGSFAGYVFYLKNIGSNAQTPISGQVAMQSPPPSGQDPAANNAITAATNQNSASTSTSAAALSPSQTQVQTSAQTPTATSTPPASASTPTAASTPTPAPTSTPTPTPTPAPAPKPKGQYKDGVYTGSVQDAYYGNVQVQATVSGGKITGVQFLQYPNDRSTSIYINSQAMPYLQQEAIAAQSANIDIVSGATDTSQAFVQSLASALAQAKNS